MLPETVRKEEAGWRERLVVRLVGTASEVPKLSKRQEAIWRLVADAKQIPLRELLEQAATTAATVRRLEDQGLVEIGPCISERDPYADEVILPTQNSSPQFRTESRS